MTDSFRVALELLSVLWPLSIFRCFDQRLLGGLFEAYYRLSSVLCGGRGKLVRHSDYFAGLRRLRGTEGGA